MIEVDEENGGEPVAKKPRLSDEEYKKLRKEMKENKNIVKVSFHIF